MIPLMNLDRQYASLQKDLDKAALDVLHSGKYILGENVEAFEQDFAKYCGVKYAVGVGNGTDALVIALRACGIGEGDEVITTAMSFFATAEAIAVVGATPVFVDCKPDTFLIDAGQISKKITEKTKAVIPVHLYGQCADMDAILALAEKYGLKVIEDAAQAAGAEYKGKKAGSMGDVGCISFFPTKNLGAAGDGGIIMTNDKSIYKQCMAYRVHGSGENGLYTYHAEIGEEMHGDALNFGDNLPKYYNFVIGYNSRMDALQAALLRVKLPYLDKWNQTRREIAGQYNQGISNKKIKKPVIQKDNMPIYYTYVITTDDRELLRQYLAKEEIASGVYFPVPLHLQKVFAGLGYQKGDMPNAEYIAEHGLALPMFPELYKEEISYICQKLNAW